MKQSINLQKRWDVVTVGDVFVDLVMSGFAALPALGEEAYAKTMRREIGGGAVITACGLAKLGMRSAVLACVGADDGEWMRTRLQNCAVDISCLQSIADQPTGLSVAVSTAEDRAFFTYRGANDRLPDLLSLAATKELFARARHVHLAFPVERALLCELAEHCRNLGVTLSLDVGWHPDWLTDRLLRPALRNLDLFLPNEREAALLTGQTLPELMLQGLAKKRFPPVAVKLGENGAASLRAGAYLHVTSYGVMPLDTTGAGDCFDAGFLYGWLNGMPIADCLRWGNICGALSTQSLGGIAGFPSRKEAEQRMSAT